MHTQGLSIIIPVYNEEKGITGVVRKIRSLMTQDARPFEIIVVDDGSEDGTLEAVREIEGASWVSHHVNRGYGAAVKTGVEAAQFPHICIIDGDGTYPGDKIPHLYAELEDKELDMVIGARIGKDATIPLVRRPAKWVLGRLADRISGRQIPDVNSGLRVFRRSIILQFWNLLPDGFSLTTTLTLALLTNSYRVGYIAIDYRKRVGRSKINPLKDTANFFLLILRIGLYFAPLKVFLPLSAVTVLSGIIWGVASLLIFGRLADASMMIIIMTGMQIAVVGFLAELINRRIPNPYHSENENSE